MNHAVSGAGFGRALHLGVQGPAISTDLSRAAEELRAAPDPHRGLALATEALTEGMPGCAVAVLLPDGDGLRVAAASAGSLLALKCVDAACADGPARAALHSGRAQSWRSASRHASGAFDGAARAAGFRSAYGLPFVTGRRAEGAVLVLSGSRRLANDVLEHLWTLAEAMAEVLAHDEASAAASSGGHATGDNADKEPLV